MATKPTQSRVALITGASRLAGIGASIARHLAKAGYDIYLTYYRPYDKEMPWGSVDDEATQLLQELQTYDIRAIGYEADLVQPQTPPLIFNHALQQFGQVDILVNNAAYSVDTSIDQLTPDLIDAHHAVNVRGMMLLCAEFVRHWQSHPTQQHGRIINLTSGQGLYPMPHNLAYVASKGAVDAFTASLSAEIMHQHITVNAVDPGGTDTGWMSPELLSELEAQSPRGRVSLPDDAARLVKFLASEDADWLTGQIIRSRGGV